MSSKFKVKKLDNGVTLLLCNDPTKHVVKASITVKFGGDITDFKVNNKSYHISEGIAHYLEHYLIEYSKYGNAFQYFTQHEYTDFNGFTTGDYTEFHISTPHDYLHIIEELLDIVNKPVFTEENIESNKPAIIEEINKKADDKFANFFYFTMDRVFQKLKLKNALGTKEGIHNLKIDEVKLAYNSFYIPSNQTIAISGCFDEEEVINLINNYYKDAKNEKVSLKKVNEPLEPKEKYAEVKSKVHDTFTRITYKYPIKDYKKEDLIKLDYYLGIYLNNSFDPSSKLFQKLLDKHVIDYGINYSYEYYDKYLIITISNYTLKDEEFIKEVNKTINERILDEEYFNVCKNRSLISAVCREDDPHKKMSYQKGMFFDYNYKKEIKAKSYDRFNFTEYQEFINKLTFDNYVVTKMIKEEEK